MIPDWRQVVWRKSSHSGGSGGQCVEIAGTCGFMAVRDSKNPRGPRIAFSKSAFESFLANLKASPEH
jgi:hypothetical protein